MSLRLSAHKAKPIKSVKKLESYKKALLERREKLAEEVRTATANMISEDESYADAVDQASADADRAILVSMKNRDRNILAQIDEALNRIESGHFGECESCKESISEARIKAFPLTTLCIDCKAELESEEARFNTSRAL